MGILLGPLPYFCAKLQQNLKYRNFLKKIQSIRFYILFDFAIFAL